MTAAPGGTPCFTIGHSNQTIEDFVGALQRNGVTSVIDVRKLAGSRANPQFNADSLGETLAREGIAFRGIPELTGRRGRSTTVPAEVNGMWQNQSFHNYADYALSAEFRRGLDEVIAEGQTARTAVMCAEAVWWRCHRRLIADYLIAAGVEVRHIFPGGHSAMATMTPGAVAGSGGAVAGSGGAVTYPVP